MTSHRRKIRSIPFAELSGVKREIDGEVEAVNWILDHLGSSLPSESPTAKAILRRAPWEEILQLARWEGTMEVAALLEDAFETLYWNRRVEGKCESREHR